MTTPTAPAPVAPAAPAAAKPTEAPAAKPSDAPATEAAKVAEKMRMLKLKVDGLDEVELPETEVLKMASHNAKRLLEAKKQTEELATLRKRLKDDPDGVLAELGLDLDARAIDRLNKKVQAQLDDETLTPEQKEMRAWKAEKAAFEKAKAERETNEKKSAHDAQVQKQKEHFAAVIREAFAHTSLPQNGPDEQLFTAQLMAQALKQSVDNKLFVNPAVLAKQTEEMFRTATKPVLAKMQAEHLADFIGPDALKGLVRIYAQRNGLAATAAAGATAAKKAQTPAEKRRAEQDATQQYFGGTRRAWKR
jgi:hypothetical protein